MSVIPAHSLEGRHAETALTIVCIRNSDFTHTVLKIPFLCATQRVIYLEAGALLLLLLLLRLGKNLAIVGQASTTFASLCRRWPLKRYLTKEMNRVRSRANTAASSSVLHTPYVSLSPPSPPPPSPSNLQVDRRVCLHRILNKLS